MQTIQATLTSHRAATIDDIVRRLTDTTYDWTAVSALGWGMGNAQLNIDDAVKQAMEAGRIVSQVRHGKQFVRIAPTYKLSYDTKTGHHDRCDLTARRIQVIGTLLSRAADRGEAWNIAVLDADGTDVTFDFACFQD